MFEKSLYDRFIPLLHLIYCFIVREVFHWVPIVHISVSVLWLGVTIRRCTGVWMMITVLLWGVVGVLFYTTKYILDFLKMTTKQLVEQANNPGLNRQLVHSQTLSGYESLNNLIKKIWTSASEGITFYSSSNQTTQYTWHYKHSTYLCKPYW